MAKQNKNSKTVDIRGYQFSMNPKGEIICNGKPTNIQVMGGQKKVFAHNGAHFPLLEVKALLAEDEESKDTKA